MSQAMKWVNIGGRGFHPMGEPTGEPWLVFWYTGEKNADYVMIQPSNNMVPTVLSGKDGSPVYLHLRKGEKNHLRIDLARALWDYVVANGWVIKGQGVGK